MDAKALTFEQWLAAVAAVGLAMLTGFTIIVYAADSLRWYKLRHKRIARNDGSR